MTELKCHIESKNMQKLRRTIMLLPLLFSLGGCIGYFSYPDQARLCTGTSDYQEQSAHERYDLRNRDGSAVRVALIASDITTGDSRVWWGDGEHYWIRLTVHAEKVELQSRSGNAEATSRYEPVLYDPQRAYVEVANGMRVYADPVVFDAEPNGYGVPRDNPTTDFPVDINSTEFHGYGRRKSDRGTAFIRFPVAPPDAGAAWSVHLGSIQVGNTRVEIRPYKLCFQSGKRGITTLRP